MIQVIIIIIGFIIYSFLEAKMDYYIILNEEDLRRLETEPFKAKDQQDRTNGWHSVNWFMYFIIALMAALLLFSLFRVWLVFLIIISIAAIRILFFNIRKNLMRNLKWYYVGDNGVEGKFKGKETLYYVLALIALISTVSYLILSLKI